MSIELDDEYNEDGKPCLTGYGHRERLAVGARVKKVTGDYRYDGVVRGVIVKKSGEIRYAVEDERGLLLILNRSQLEVMR